MGKLRWVGWVGFVLGALPLLSLALFSPGLTAEGIMGIAIFAFALATLMLLLLSARRHKVDLLLVVLQIVLLALVVYETLSDSSLYMGT
jgi:hypothetical protein